MPRASAARDTTTRAAETIRRVHTDPLPNVGDFVAGKYRVERVIGRGAMGAVFAARDELLGRRVALKLMALDHGESPECVARFFNEARAAARIESEHIARILDLGRTDGGAPFIALELLEGADLEQVLESRGPAPVAEVVGWILQALEAIAEAHSLGIVHRDLKPANLFLTQRRDGRQVVKVLDFGISKDLRATAGGPRLTMTASILGSPAYMAPEQLRDARTVDARADIWAIGVALYELLTGHLPFRAENVADLFVAVLQRDVVPARTHRGDVPPALEGVLRRCLAREPGDRFPDVAALAEALVPFAGPGGDTAAERIRRILQAGAQASREGAPSIERRLRRAGTVAAIVMAAGLATVATLWEWLPSGGHAAQLSPVAPHTMAAAKK